jgi:tetratricopeptide (TPR) repeat protein
LFLLASSGAIAQSSQSSQNPPTPTQQQTDKKPPSDTLTLDSAPPPVSAEEDAAFKAFDSAPMTDLNKKIQLGEEFLQKYPQSRYRPPVYSTLTHAYLQTNNVQKMQEVGEKEIELNPNDVQVLAILAQTIPRAMNSSTPNKELQLEKAEKYAKSAIELTPTISKPPNLTDDQFTTAKNQTLAMAHSGLGLVYFRRGKYAEAIPELEQATKIDPNPEQDPVNFYLLGIANEKASHFDDSVAAFNKCAAIPGSLQAACKNGAEEAKKKSATELSAPK